MRPQLYPLIAFLAACLSLKANQATDYPLTLSITCEQDAFSLGDEIPVVFTITNAGNEVYEYGDRNYDRSGRMPEYRLVATNANGEAAPDPRAKIGIYSMGGLTQPRELKPGESFSKTIALNRWALLEPGIYEVTGFYGHDPFGAQDAAGQVASVPIAITILPRNDEAMATYIDELTAQLQATTDDQERAALTKKLMYTQHPLSAQPLLWAAYQDGSGYWADEGLRHYLPHSKEVMQQIIHSAYEHGLSSSMLTILEEEEIDREILLTLIEISLAESHPNTWPTGGLGAQKYGDDRFSERLIAIANQSEHQGRAQAIHALANHRNAQNILALRSLLEDSDPRVRKDTHSAIYYAINSRGNATGEPMLKIDFPAEYWRERPN
ncbi:HEAT repeat domain-containing protein [Cerasicoccus frondis]|uniref:HEAT repeat domain-containing protein n=1 Tax=Cerasicoccus frondis TaxID=490090 RepID=UPI0028525D34|nr:HEAT repeat domain-containing protein [Cerasicoccus frondis]